MSSDLLGISVSGLRVAQTALSTTGHNISNAGVDGYSRQRTINQTNPATPTGVGFIGNGVNTQTIERVVNEFAIQQVRTDTSLHHDLDLYHTNTSLLDNLLADTSTGLASGLESFFASMQNGLDDPTSIPARQLILSETENLSDRFNTLYSRFQAIDESVNDSLTSAVAQVNALVENIAHLNLKISDVSGGGQQVQPNDLLDQRDEALRSLSELVSIQVYEQGAGQLNVVVGNGQNLVVGTESRQLNLQASAEDSTKLDVVFTADSGGQIITSLISGGEIGGLIRFRDNAMKDVYNEFGRVAVVMADTFNNAHEQGVNLDNDFGGLFFYDVNERLVSENRVIGNSNNPEPFDRQMHLNIADSSQLTTSDYDVSIEPGGLFRIERLNDGEEVASGLLSGSFPFSVSFDGLELVFESGTFQDGDSFKLQPVKSGGRDFSSALVNAKGIAFASPVLTDASITNSGSGAISQGEVLSLDDVDGNPLSLLENAGVMNPPMVVKFTSESTYDVLDNSDPGNPIQLEPPIRNQKFIKGVSNPLFGTDPGSTQVSTNGDMAGLPVGRLPLSSAAPVDPATINNGYPAEAITITVPSDVPAAPPTTHNIFTGLNQSAKEIANALSSVPGVSANAFTYMEVSNLGLTQSAPLQITLNGEDLLEYDVAGVNLSPDVPDPAAIPPDAFNDYMADRINQNVNLSGNGVYAVSGNNPVTGASELRVYSSVGDDLKVSLEAGAGESLAISDGNNVATALTIGGAGLSESLAVGGLLDVTLAETMTLSTFPPNSMLFGDTTAADFAELTYVGIQASISGVPDVNDTFTFDFNLDAASDNRNALVLAGLATARTIDNGLTNYAGGYGSLVEKIGIETSSARINSDASEQVLVQSVARRDSVSGVNLDEEAANLIHFEQMYSANTQVISVARDLFDRLLSAF